MPDETRSPGEPRTPDEPAADTVAGDQPVRHRGRVVALVVLAVAVLAGGGAVALAGRGGGCPPDGAALAVGGRKVTVDELERRVEVLQALYGLTPPPASDKAKSDAFSRDLAKSMAVALMIDGEVADRNLGVADKTARDALDRYIANAFPEGGRAKFVEALGNQGVSEADVLSEFRRLLETRRLFDVETGDVKVTDADVETAFADRKDRLAIAERRKLRHLVVADEAAAQGALTRIRGGAAFATVAGEVSLDAATKGAGGELGTLTAAELDPAFRDVAFAAAVNVPFGPVRTDRGWHVGVVEEIIPGRAVTLDEVRQPLRDQLVGERRLERWRKYLGELIVDADACYAARFRPTDPDAPPPDLGGSGITGSTPSVPGATPSTTGP